MNRLPGVADSNRGTEGSVELFRQILAVEVERQVIKASKFFRLRLFSVRKLQFKNATSEETFLIEAGPPGSQQFCFFLILGLKIRSLASLIAHPVKRKEQQRELRSQLPVSILLKYESMETSGRGTARIDDGCVFIAQCYMTTVDPFDLKPFREDSFAAGDGSAG